MAHPPNPAAPALSARTHLRRLPGRGHYDAATIHAILDAGFLCHLGLLDSGGFPLVVPTAYGRAGDQLYFHGSAAGRLMRSLKDGIEVCCTVTHLDGLVLARSVFHHSMNYRSVMVFGRARAVSEAGEKLRALEVISNQIAPGRWQAARLPNAQELKATQVLALPLSEASAKLRIGPPKDEAADYALPIWAGLVPCALVYGAPIADPALSAGLAPPQPLLPGRPRTLDEALASRAQ